MLLLILLAIAVMLVAGVVARVVYGSKEEKLPEYESLMDEINAARTSERIFFTLSTIPSRLGDLEPTLRSLAAQTVLRTGDEVVINIPWKSKREETDYVIPEKLQNLVDTTQFLRINRCEDWGPSTKLIPTVADIATRPTDIILPVDDDCVFPVPYFEELVLTTLRDPTTVYGYHGLHINRHGAFRFAQRMEGPVPVVETVTGAVYRRSFFSDAFLQPVEGPCFFTDDLVLALEMIRNGVPRKLLMSARDTGTTRGREGMPMVQNLEAANPLYKINMSGGSSVKWSKDTSNNCKCISLHKELRTDQPPPKRA